MKCDEGKTVGAGEGRQENTVRVWCVYDKTRGDVESYHPSYAWAWEQLTRHAEARPASMDATIGELRATFSAERFRLVTTAWDSYRWLLQVAASGREASVGQRLVRLAALSACRPHRRVQAEMKLLEAGRLPKRRAPAHALDLPDVVTVTDRRAHLGPVLSRWEALRRAAEENRQALAEGAGWDGQWRVVVELGNILPITSTSPEFAGDVGIESLVSRRALRLVRPTEAEIEQFAQAGCG